MRAIGKPTCVALMLGMFVAATARGQDEPSVPKPAQPTGQKITLKLNLPKGTVRKSASNVDMKMDIGIGDQPIAMNMVMGMEMGFDVQDVDTDGNHTVKLTYDRMKMKMDGPVALEFDSAKKDGDFNPLTAAFGALVGQSLTMKMTPQGKITEVTGADELAKKLGAAIPGAEEQIKQQLKETENQVGQLVANFPDKPVDNGDTWTAKMKMGGATPMTVDATYTLLDRTGEEALVGFDGKIEGALTGTMTGTMHIDLKTGWTNSANMKMKVSGKQGGATIDMDATTKITSEK